MNRIDSGYSVSVFFGTFFHCVPGFNFSMNRSYPMKKARYLLLASPFLLAACGEGYEMIKTDAMFPYGNQRTAGSGVAYVVAKMMPKKELNLQPVAARPAPQPLEETKEIIKEIPQEPEQPMKPADDIFKEKQMK